MLNYIWRARKVFTGGGMAAAWIAMMENNPYALAGFEWEWKAAVGFLLVGFAIWAQPNMSKKERERLSRFFE